MELREGMLYNRMFSSDSDTFRHLVHCCTDSDKLFIVEWCNIATQMYRVGGPTKDSTIKERKLRGNHKHQMKIRSILLSTQQQGNLG